MGFIETSLQPDLLTLNLVASDLNEWDSLRLLTDEVTGIWDAAEGSALVTEIITSSHRPD